MASKNTALQQYNNSQNQFGSDCQQCRLYLVGDSGQEECLMEVIRQQWAEPFGDSSYCSHPSAKQFVDFVNSMQP